MRPLDRIPFALRFRRPGFCRQVGFLAAELRRSGIDPPQPDERCELELENEAASRTVAERRVARGAGRIRRLAASGLRQVLRARSALADVAGADAQVVRLDGRAMTVAQVRSRVAGAAATRGSRALDRSGRPLRFVGFGLLLVDAAALVVILGFLLNVDWSRPDPANLVTVLALSVFGAAVQAVLAVHLGRRLWTWRHADPDDEPEFPPRSSVVLLGAGFLALVSTFAAAALFLRVQVEGTVVGAGPLATALGLLLGASALAAPWCLVADEAYGSAPAERTLRAAGRILVRADRARRQCERRAHRRLGAATRALHRADWLLAAVVHGVGLDYLPAHRRLLMARGLAWGSTVCTARSLAPETSGPRSVLPLPAVVDHRCLTGPVEALRLAVAEAGAEYAVVVEKLRPADLDLAG